MPDGPRMQVEYSATANVEPGRHLSIFVVPRTKADVVPEPAVVQLLSVREREVQNRAHAIAVGLRRGEIAMDLGSPNLPNFGIESRPRPGTFYAEGVLVGWPYCG